LIEMERMLCLASFFNFLGVALMDFIQNLALLVREGIKVSRRGGML